MNRIYLVSNNLDALYYPTLKKSLGIEEVLLTCELPKFELSLLKGSTFISEVGEGELIARIDNYFKSNKELWMFNDYFHNKLEDLIGFTHSTRIPYEACDLIKYEELLDILELLGVKAFLDYIRTSKVKYYVVTDKSDAYMWCNDPIETLFISAGMIRINEVLTESIIQKEDIKFKYELIKDYIKYE